MLYRYNVPPNKGRMEEPQVLDELVHVVGECTSQSSLAASSGNPWKSCHQHQCLGAQLSESCIAHASRTCWLLTACLQEIDMIQNKAF